MPNRAPSLPGLPGFPSACLAVLLLLGTATAGVFSYRATTTTLHAALSPSSLLPLSMQEQMLRLVAHVSPQDPAWSSNLPWWSWGQVECPAEATACVLDFAAAFTNSSGQADRRTGWLDLAALNTSFPAAALTVQHLGVHVDMTALPQALLRLNVTNSSNFTTVTRPDWGCPPNHVNLTSLPPGLHTLVLRNSGIVGRLDLFSPMALRVLDFTGNAGLVGALDLTKFTTMGQNPIVTSIVTQGTSIERLVVVAGPPEALYITTQPYGTPVPPHKFWSLYVDNSTLFLPLNAADVDSIRPMYFCREPVADEADPYDVMVDILQVRHDAATNKDDARMLRNVTECRRDLSTRNFFVTSGYVSDSAAWATSFSKCLPEANASADFGYVVKARTTADTLSVVRVSDTSQIAAYGLCATVANTPSYHDYYSASIGPLDFVDIFMNSELGRMRRYVNGTETVCDYPWPIIWAPTYCFTGGPCVAASFNFKRIALSFGPCFPSPQHVLASASSFSSSSRGWDGMGPFKDHWRLFQSNGDGGITAFGLELNTLAPVANGTYCFAALHRSHAIVVNATGVKVVRVSANGTTEESPLWPRLMLYQPMVPMGDDRLRFGIQDIGDFIAAVAEYLPEYNPRTQQPFGNFTADGSAFHVASQQYPHSAIFLGSSNGKHSVLFDQESCALPVDAATYCAPVDFGEGGATSVMHVARTTGGINMTLWRTALVQTPSEHGRGHHIRLGLLTTCTESSAPLWYQPQQRPSGQLSGVAAVTMQLSDCFPNASRTAVLKLPFVGGIFTPDTDAPARLSIDFHDSHDPFNSLHYSVGQCLSTWGANGPVSAEVCSVTDSFRAAASAPTATNVQRCVLPGVCGPLSTATWHPDGSTLATWNTGFADVCNPLPLDSLRRPRDTITVDVQSCVPSSCYLRRSVCRDLAAWTAQVASCVISRGGSTSDLVPLLDWPESCLDGDEGDVAFSDVRSWVALPASEQRLRVECGAGGDDEPVFWAVLPPGNGTTGHNRAFTLDLASAGLRAACTTCVPLVVELSIALPFEVLIFSAVVNVLVILVSNYLLDPFVGPRLVTLKMLLFAPALLLSHRERRRLRERLRGQLNPEFLEDDAVDAHVATVVKAVEEEHDRQRQFEAGETGEAAAMFRRTNRRTQYRFEKAYRSVLFDHERHLDSACVQKPAVLQCLLRIRAACAHFDHSSRTFLGAVADDAASSHDRGATTRAGLDTEALFRHPHPGAAAGATASPVRDVCALDRDAAAVSDERDQEAASLCPRHQRSAADVATTEPSSGTGHRPSVQGDNGTLPELERPLIGHGSSGDDDAGRDEDRDDGHDSLDDRLAAADDSDDISDAEAPVVRQRSAGGIQRREDASTTSLPDASVEAFDNFVEVTITDFKRQSIEKTGSVGRALLALDASVDAHWTAFARAGEWLDRRSLIPKDWLLFVQLAVVIIFFFACLVSGIRSGGVGDQSRVHATSAAWRMYEAVYFGFLNSTMPGALLVNAGFRIAYGRRLRRRPKDVLVVFVWRFVKKVASDPFVAVPVAVMLPALLTHVLPMWIYFAPFTAINAIGVAFATFLVRRCPAPPAHVSMHKAAFLAALGTRLLLRIVATLAAVGALQFGFNYGVLVYDRKEAWPSTFTTEWQARSLPCALDVLEMSGQGLFNRLMMLIS